MAGQRIVTCATNVTNPSANLNLVNTVGSNQGTAVTISNSPPGQTFFMDTQKLAKTGIYQLWVQHSLSNIGSETPQISSVLPDTIGTITVPSAGSTGPTSTVTTTSTGQNGSLTFSGTAGQQLGFNETNYTYPSGACRWFLYDPSNTLVTNGTCFAGFIDPSTINPLTATGTYTLVTSTERWVGTFVTAWCHS